MFIANFSTINTIFRIRPEDIHSERFCLHSENVSGKMHKNSPDVLRQLKMCYTVMAVLFFIPVFSFVFLPSMDGPET